ncbi:helicase associated domain-containing protein [Streptomyces flaveolus]|uniref:helicase associated domain-containing protein n=1 Tax=Streptomyces flaveolus TaxID=67297 RepID=UPI00343E3A42
MLDSTLGMEPAAEGEQPVQRTQDDRWAINLAAARQYFAREGHLRVPRQHAEHLDDGTDVKLGMWIANTRRRAHKLTHQRHTDLNQLGMRW